MKEKLSAFIDAESNELEEHQVLQALATDSELRTIWERYHLMRAAMTRQLETVVPPDFANRIYSRLDNSITEKKFYLASIPRFAAGLAMAASVAAVAIFAFQVFHQPTTTDSTQLAQQSQTVPVSAPIVPASAARAADTPELPDQLLNTYLVGHNEYMPTGSMSSMLPYVRVVAHDRD